MCEHNMKPISEELNPWAWVLPQCHVHVYSIIICKVFDALPREPRCNSLVLCIKATFLLFASGHDVLFVLSKQVLHQELLDLNLHKS